MTDLRRFNAPNDINLKQRVFDLTLENERLKELVVQLTSGAVVYECHQGEIRDTARSLSRSQLQSIQDRHSSEQQIVVKAYLDKP